MPGSPVEVAGSSVDRSCEIVRKSCGTVCKSCRIVRVAGSSVDAWRRTDSTPPTANPTRGVRARIGPAWVDRACMWDLGSSFTLHILMLQGCYRRDKQGMVKTLPPLSSERLAELVSASSDSDDPFIRHWFTGKYEDSALETTYRNFHLRLWAPRAQCLLGTCAISTLIILHAGYREEVVSSSNRFSAD